MRKDEMAAQIHQQAGISEQEAARLLDWILELFKPTLQKEEPIAIHNFSRFTVRKQTISQRAEFSHRRGYDDPGTPSGDLSGELPAQG